MVGVITCFSIFCLDMEFCLDGRLAWMVDVCTESAMIGCWKLTHCGPRYFTILTSKDAGKLMKMASDEMT